MNGKIWDGKGYDSFGNNAFEIKNGKGNITEYDIDGGLIFKGEYLNGERNGKGAEYFSSWCPGSPLKKLKFEGEY